MEFQTHDVVKKIKENYGTVKCFCNKQQPPLNVPSFYKLLENAYGSRVRDGKTRAGTKCTIYLKALTDNGIVNETGK